MKETGIYYILNRITGKCYVGSSSDDFNRRWTIHKHQLNRNKHANFHLQNAWNKYGSENFEFSVLEIVNPKLCIEREQFYIDNIKPEYNILQKAGSPFGFRHSDASKKKRSISLMGHYVSQETKQKISNKAKKRFSNNPEGHPMFGKNHNEKTKSLIKEKRKFQDTSAYCKPIKQINKQNNEIIKIWESITLAANTLSIHTGNISYVCKNKLKSTGGFKWEYV